MDNLIRYHPRFWIAVAAGVICFFFLPPQWALISRILVCWNCGVVLFLTLIFFWMTSLSAERIGSEYLDEDESATFILTVVVVAALLSVAAIVVPLAALKQTAGVERVAHTVLVTLTLVNSWLLVPTMFTTHYADMFYSVTRPTERPLTFPNTPMPIFWDFAYFSFTIAAACQTSDVSTNNAPIRRIVLAHTLVSFLFNASILGFAINVTAGLIGGG